MDLLFSLTDFWGGCDSERLVAVFAGFRQRVRKRGIQTMVSCFSLLRLLVLLKDTSVLKSSAVGVPK